jgi:hypothetical protein
MTPARAAAYIGGAVLLAAWLSSAATSPQETEQSTSANPQGTSGTDSVGFDMQEQAARLRAKLAAAPVPQQPARNPFSFAVRELPAARARVHAAVPELPPASNAPLVEVEPPLSLVGMAERQTPAGPVRTAVIAGDADDVFLVSQGEEVAGRYRVTVIAADAVELQHLSTGAVRRLMLR